jgi:NAD(P)-dependent dehydrogenase (short-subunit alcohol dehydrogenase family)
MEVNLTANWHLIRALDPLLRLSAEGRVIFTTCAAARDATPYWGAYAASKAALETMARIYAGEMTKTNVRVNLVDPGIVRTKLRAQGFPGEDSSKLRAPQDVTEPFVTAAMAGCAHHGKVLRL